MRRVALPCGRLLVLPLAVSCLAGSASASVTPPSTSGCRAVADMPQRDPRAFAQPRLVARGELRCSRAATLSVEVCARRGTRSGGLVSFSRPIWCAQSSQRVGPTRKVVVRARPHRCTRGDVYVSYLSIDGGLTWDQSPFVACGTP